MTGAAVGNDVVGPFVAETGDSVAVLGVALGGRLGDIVGSSNGRSKSSSTPKASSVVAIGAATGAMP